MISYIDFDNFRRSFEIPRSRRLVTVGERLSDDKSYIRDTIIKACWGTPWRTRRWTGSGTVKRRCRSLTTGAVSLQLGRRRLGQKNRVDEKVFVECNIQKESKVKSEKWKVKSQKSKVKSEKWKVKSEKWKVKLTSAFSSTRWKLENVGPSICEYNIYFSIRWLWLWLLDYDCFVSISCLRLVPVYI